MRLHQINLWNENNIATTHRSRLEMNSDWDIFIKPKSNFRIIEYDYVYNFQDLSPYLQIISADFDKAKL